MRVLILGGSGLLGSELLRQAVTSGLHATGTYGTSPGEEAGAVWQRLDLRDRDRTKAYLRSVDPDVVINAAYRQRDWSSTADGAANAAIAAAEAGARLVFVSSDAVFSGEASPYSEGALPDPITAYGAAKAAAETVVRAITPDALISRTSLIISDEGASAHERRAIAAATQDDHGVHFTDDIRCPIHVADLAAALLELAATDRAGVHNLAGPDAISRYELARLIAVRDGLDPDRIKPGLRAEHRPAGPFDVRLDCAATHRHLRTQLRGARQFLHEQRERP